MDSLSEPERLQPKVQSTHLDPERQRRAEIGVRGAHNDLLRVVSRGASGVPGGLNLLREAGAAAAGERVAELIRGRQLAESGPGAPPGGGTSGGVRCVPQALPGGHSLAPQRRSQAAGPTVPQLAAAAAAARLSLQHGSQPTDPVEVDLNRAHL